MDFDEFSQSEMLYITLSDFKLFRELGDGAFGTVWLAKYTKTQKLYALKMIKNDSAPKDIVLSSDLSLTVDHPNLMRVYDYFYEKINQDNYIIFIMEYIKGEDLYYKIRRGDKINLYKYLPQLLDGIEYLHENKLVHRDIKPENVIINENDDVKIIDYDFLILIHKLRDRVGTPFYAAPEIYDGEKMYDNRIDLWSLGTLIWCCIIGQEPFDAIDRKSLKLKVITEEPDWSLVDDEDCYPILKGLLEKDPDKRWSIGMVRKGLKEKQNILNAELKK